MEGREGELVAPRGVEVVHEPADERRLDQAALVVALLVPGVGEERPQLGQLRSQLQDAIESKGLIP